MSSHNRRDSERRTDKRQVSYDRRWEPERRRVNFGVPPASSVGHLFDFVFFRALGGWLVIHEASQPSADWKIMVAAGGVFLMPDAIRGKQSPILRMVFQIVEAVVKR